MTSPIGGNHSGIDERFENADLDQSLWFPWYLPHWSSKVASKATYAVQDRELHLSIPREQPLWCADLHQPRLRVSGLQTGCFAGSLSSVVGQQPFRDGLTVQEEQAIFRGYLQLYGKIVITMRMSLSPSSMAAAWLVGFEDEPERSGEICIAEIFGKEVDADRALVGMGIHQFRDPELTEEFSKTPIAMDISRDISYGVEWRPDGVAFHVDGAEVHHVSQSPTYPMQLMIAVFDFPDWECTDAQPVVPELVISRVRGESCRSTGA